jgi:hypothetical protein
MKLTLHNPSKKKLTGVTVTLTDTWGALHQIEDQPELHGPTEKKILLGDLQPHQSRTLHTWTQISYVGWHYTKVPTLFEITADEVDKRTLRLPFPTYLKGLLRLRVLWSFNVAMFALAAVFWLIYWVRR